MPIQSVTEFKKLKVRYDARLMFLEDSEFRDKYAKPSAKRKRLINKAARWATKFN